jgi:uncharacterized BrkB/YihY/UPF0761 family membrane protein
MSFWGPRPVLPAPDHRTLSAVGSASIFAAPFLRWTIAVAFTVLAVELIYFLAPNVKQQFGRILPGAVVAVGCWLLLSWSLGLYFQHFNNLNKTYGTLGWRCHDAIVSS